MKQNWLLIIAGPLLLASLSGCGTPHSAHAAEAAPQTAHAVAAVRVVRRDLDRGMVVTGELTPFQEVEVMAKVAGYVRRMYVDVGDSVSQGQVLAVLEVPEMTDDLNRAGAAIQRNRADLNRAEDEIRRAETAHELAHVTYHRLSNVSRNQPGLVAQQEIDDAQTRDQMAEAQVAAVRSALAAAQEQIKVSEAEQSKYKTMLQYTRVVAPFAGVVTRRYANVGSMIQAGVASQTQTMPIVRLSQNNLLRVVVPVPESAAGIVHQGSSVEIRVPSLAKSFAGKVARTAERIDTSTRTMRTEIDVPNPGGVLIPGMYAEISLSLAMSAQVIAVPLTAIMEEAGQKRVWVVDSGSRLQVRRISTGLETPDFIEVPSGLREGEIVVAALRGQFRPGQAVIPKFEDSASGAKGGE
ncbi:MAG: efflux RND transporter periplasmic adaptor subunit [Acidobacteria bacterium]|nr:efflux RND transporter periplasmic adaptor subunit [Acidobacteriota bacterium]